MALSEKQKKGLVLTTILQVAEVFGKKPQTVTAWINAGMPRHDITNRTSSRPEYEYRIWEIIPWLREKGPWQYPRRGAPRQDDGLHPSASPVLEETRRIKLIHAQLDLAERRGQLVDLEQMKGACQILSSVYRELGERLVSQFGKDAGKMVNDAIEEFQRRIKRDFPSPTPGTEVSLLDGPGGNGAGSAPNRRVGGDGDRGSHGRPKGKISPRQSSG